MKDEATPLVSDRAVMLLGGIVLMIVGVTLGRDLIILAVFAWLTDA